jgi:6-phosphogluconolactonase
MSALPPNSLVFRDPESLARAAAARIAEAIAAAGGERIALCLSGGSTPKRLYQILAGPEFVQAFPWSRLHWFWGDERMVPPDHPDSNFGMAREALLNSAPVPPGNIYPIKMVGLFPAEAAATYERTLKTFYGAETLDPARPLFDIMLLGLGEDGHTASLFPGSATLDEEERWVVAEPRAHQSPFVPRVTLTLPALGSSRLGLFLVAGASKHGPLQAIAEGRDLPAGRVQPAGELAWLVDEAAAGGAP